MSVKLDKPTKLAYVLIILILFFPLIGTLLPDDELAKRHRRDLKQFPAAEKLVKNPTSFFKESDDWLSDRLLFSVTSPALYRKVQFYLFRDAASNNISRNKDLIFLNSHGSSEAYSAFLEICPESNIWRQTLDGLQQDWNVIQSHMKVQNIRSYGLVIPSKPILYADQLPVTVPIAIRDACQENAIGKNPLKTFAERNAEVVYPLDLFTLRRDEQTFYPVQNFHFRGASADLAAKEVISVISGPEYVSPKFRPEVKKADLVEMFGFERKILVEVQQEKVKYKIDKAESAKIAERFNISPGQFIVSKNETAPDSSRVLVLSNSFGPYVSRYIARHFGEVVQINTNRFSTDSFKIAMTDFIDQENFDVVIFAMHELGFYDRLEKFAGGTGQRQRDRESKSVYLDEIISTGWHSKRKNNVKDRWSIAGGTAKISISETLLTSHRVLSFEIRSFNPERLNSRSIEVTVCGEKDESLSKRLSETSNWREIDLKAFPRCESGGVEIEIKTDSVDSPKSFGINSDKRKLGVSINNLKAVKK